LLSNRLATHVFCFYPGSLVFLTVPFSDVYNIVKILVGNPRTGTGSTMNILRRLDRLIAPTVRRSAAISTSLWPHRWMSQSTTISPGSPSSKSTVNAAEVRGVAQILRQQKGNLGQPTSVSHPHLIQPDELVPGVELTEIKERRSQLMQNIRAYARSFGGEFNGHSSSCHMVRTCRLQREAKYINLNL